MGFIITSADSQVTRTIPTERQSDILPNPSPEESARHSSYASSGNNEAGEYSIGDSNNQSEKELEEILGRDDFKRSILAKNQQFWEMVQEMAQKISAEPTGIPNYDICQAAESCLACLIDLRTTLVQTSFAETDKLHNNLEWKKIMDNLDDILLGVEKKLNQMVMELEAENIDRSEIYELQNMAGAVTTKLRRMPPISFGDNLWDAVSSDEVVESSSDNISDRIFQKIFNVHVNGTL